jgi:serine/threonine protein kinase
MEHLKGNNLSSYIEYQNSICNKRKVEIMYQICRGIEYLHRLGITHRDIKPANIAMTSDTPNATAKIIDFGLSTYLSDEETLNLTCGTLNYMAPEILLNKSYNKSVDIWSLGMVYYYLLYYNLPHQCVNAKNDVERIKTVCEKDIDFPQNHDQRVIQLVSTCLRRNPGQRYTVKGLLEDLKFMKKDINI